MSFQNLEQISETKWRLKKTGNMRVDGIVYTSASMLDDITKDEALTQVSNVASLPGIMKASFGMPDIHWGYGFPIGGVAAFDIDSGVVSPGGVGYDINCGVRLLRTDLVKDDISKKLEDLCAVIFNSVPSGVGSKRVDFTLKDKDLKDVLKKGAYWAIENGYGYDSDIEFIEDGGMIKGAEPEFVSKRAIERGSNQLGTVGSGNHFIEVGFVEEIYDEEAAEIYGLSLNQITVMIHSGSRGLGYQICDDYLKIMQKATAKYGISIPDRQLCSAPIKSDEGQRYLSSMACAANYAFANRQIMTHLIRDVFMKFFKLSPSTLKMNLIYDVAHNIAKIEKHMVDGKLKTVCVHRKGATRAFSENHNEIPQRYRKIGQPVLIPGDMGRCSYVLRGSSKAMEETFGSTCHGAGRVLSRNEAKKHGRGRQIDDELRKQGIIVCAAGRHTLLEEMPSAYKDVSQVVDVVHNSGISLKVAKLRPLAVVKG
ncbi:MAG: RtcB family protein [Candidatus Schekmanbacteria bacterium]|nr:MAG: RtcB family protein [Candidatus Schekmanbacteria bacterium]